MNTVKYWLFNLSNSFTILILIFTGCNGYSLKKLLSHFEMEHDVSHDAFGDTCDLFYVVRNARPRGTTFGWYTRFLMSSFKPTSKFVWNEISNLLSENWFFLYANLYKILRCQIYFFTKRHFKFFRL